MAKKQTSNAIAEEDFDPSDFVLNGPNDRIVSKVLNGEKVFNVFSGKTLSNLSIKDKLVDGLWSIEDEKTQQVRDFMLEKIEAQKLEREKKSNTDSSEVQTPVV